jgi:5'-nucleotidase (lipoprotein e(P4) family)
MKKQLFLLSTIALIFASCSSTQPLSQRNDCHHPKESTILWQQTAAEYDALCHQAFNLATFRLQQAYQAGDDLGNNKPPAIIMDLDETVLDNSPYNGKLIIDNENYSSDSWDEWVQHANADLVPGAQEFISFAKNRGVDVYFISNREEKHMESTKRNLNKLGLQINPEFILLKSNSPEKSNRRNQVEQSHNIIMLIGDNLADFNDVFDDNLDYVNRKDLVNNEFKELFGEKFIILPNPMYGDWEKSLENESPKGTKHTDYGDQRKYIQTY